MIVGPYRPISAFDWRGGTAPRQIETMPRLVQFPPIGTLPVIGFVGASGSGKTTLIEAVLPLLIRAGLRTAVLKHAHHGFDMDRPGKDSHRVREAGAAQVLVASRERWVLMGEETPGLTEPAFHELLARFDPSKVDLVLVEGFAREEYPKIEVYRPSTGKPPKCWPSDPAIIAVASDETVGVAAPVVRLDINRAQDVAEFLLEQIGAGKSSTRIKHAV